jgi:hypothetical protein
VIGNTPPEVPRASHDEGARTDYDTVAAFSVLVATVAQARTSGKVVFYAAVESELPNMMWSQATHSQDINFQYDGRSAHEGFT